MINKTLLRYFFCALLCLYTAGSNCMDEKTKQFFSAMLAAGAQYLYDRQMVSYVDKETPFENQKNYKKFYPAFKLLKQWDSSTIAKEKKYYINNYHNEFMVRLQKLVHNKDNNLEVDNFINFALEAYEHICEDKNVDLSSNDFWKPLTIKIRMMERQDGQIKKNTAVKTPLTDVYNDIKNKVENIIKNDKPLRQNFSKATEEQKKINKHAEEKHFWEKINSKLEIVSILSVPIIYRSVLMQAGDLIETNLIYYLNGNADQQKDTALLEREIENSYNRTESNLQFAEKLIPQKRDLNNEEKLQLMLEQLKRTKENNAYN